MSRKNWRVKPDIPKPKSMSDEDHTLTSLVKTNHLQHERIATLEGENERLRAALKPWAEIAKKHLRALPHGEYRVYGEPLWDCHDLLVAQMFYEERG